jgi:hypothetical protein
MRNRIVACIVIILAVILVPSTLGAITIGGHPNHKVEKIVIPTPEINPNIYLARLRVFYATIINQEQRQSFYNAILASEAVVQSQPQSTSYSGSDVMPTSWQATAICEEGGRNDPNYGYFGIKEWNGFDGYPTAGSAPLSVQLAWEAKYIGAPPDVPGRCHSY